MMATRPITITSVSQMGAPPKPCTLTYSHQVPSAKVPHPNSMPFQAARRGVLPSQRHISKAGEMTVIHHAFTGANAQASAAPAASAITWLITGEWGGFTPRAWSSETAAEWSRADCRSGGGRCA